MSHLTWLAWRAYLVWSCLEFEWMTRMDARITGRNPSPLGPIAAEVIQHSIVGFGLVNAYLPIGGLLFICLDCEGFFFFHFCLCSYSHWMTPCLWTNSYLLMIFLLLHSQPYRLLLDLLYLVSSLLDFLLSVQVGCSLLVNLN